MKVTLCLSPGVRKIVRELTFPNSQHLAAQRLPGSTKRHDRFSTLREKRASSGSSPITVAGGVCREVAPVRRTAVSLVAQ